MTQHDQQSSGVEAVTNAQPSQGRRRLVKGMIIGAPAILTVRRGFARENSMPSAVEACTSLAAFQSFQPGATEMDFQNTCQTSDETNTTPQQGTVK